nr:MAG TPA: hypothetical protein [Bacteriophage sp.]
MLFKRYANPFSFLDILICDGRLSDFISFVVEEYANEYEWNFYLHKVFDKSFVDFKRQIDNSSPPSKTSLKTTIQKSKNILQGFNPPDMGAT